MAFIFIICVVFCSCQLSARPGNHLPTCTYPFTRSNNIQSDDEFCPYPPSVSIADDPPSTPGRPLDYISYYMDEHLISTADREDTVEFFRSYMAGFLISRRERAMSLCGTNYVRGEDDSMADTRDLMCMMYGATSQVQMERFFTDTQYRLNTIVDGDCPLPLYSRVINCTISALVSDYMNGSPYPDCNDIGFNITSNGNYTETFEFTIEDATTDITMEDDVFQVDGAVREAAGLHAVPQGHLSTFGRRYFDFADSDITGVTIYYNNQVTIASSCFIGQTYPKFLRFPIPK